MQDLERIDWNLVPALNALLAERNVSRAARRLAISQPAASAALARLRRHFDDELLVRHGNRYQLTPLAAHLAPLAQEAVDSTRTVLERADSFDAAHSDREFTLLTTDYAQFAIGEQLVTRMRQEAPDVRLALRSPFGRGTTTIPDMLASADGWLSPRELLFEFPCSGLLTDRWVCIVAEDHPSVGDELTLEDCSRLPWVVPSVLAHRSLPQFERVQAHGVDARIDVSTDAFSAIPFLVRGSDRIGFVQEVLARSFATAAGVRVLECPWAMTPLNLTLWWHPDREHDPAHIWLRELIADCMATANPHVAV